MPIHSNVMSHSILYALKRRFRCPTSQYQDALVQNWRLSCESCRGAFGAQGWCHGLMASSLNTPLNATSRSQGTEMGTYIPSTWYAVGWSDFFIFGTRCSIDFLCPVVIRGQAITFYISEVSYLFHFAPFPNTRVAVSVDLITSAAAANTKWQVAGGRKPWPGL